MRDALACGARARRRCLSPGGIEDDPSSRPGRHAGERQDHSGPNPGTPPWPPVRRHRRPGRAEARSLRAGLHRCARRASRSGTKSHRLSTRPMLFPEPSSRRAAGPSSIRVNRWSLWEHSTVAWLDVPPDRLVRRLAADPVARPTFQPYRRETMARTLAERTFAYRSADLRVEASASPAAVARELAAACRAAAVRQEALRRRHPTQPSRRARHDPAGRDGGRPLVRSGPAGLLRHRPAPDEGRAAGHGGAIAGARSRGGVGRASQSGCAAVERVLEGCHASASSAARP